MGDRLTKAQELALVEALGEPGFVRGDFCSVTVAAHLAQRGLVHMPNVGSPLTPAGRLCAQLIKDRDHYRALYRESVARELETWARAIAHPDGWYAVTDRAGEGREGLWDACSRWDDGGRRRADLWAVDRAARLLRHWAKSIREGRDIPAWRGAP